MAYLPIHIPEDGQPHLESESKVCINRGSNIGTSVNYPWTEDSRAILFLRMSLFNSVAIVTVSPLYGIPHNGVSFSFALLSDALNSVRRDPCPKVALLGFFWHFIFLGYR